MSTTQIEADFRQKVGASVRLAEEGVGRYRVFTPFLLDDGDHLAISMRQEGAQWVLSDEGHTYMHLSYDLDVKELQRGNRQRIIASALSAFAVEEREGELRLRVPDHQYGDALFSFVQALLKLNDVTFLSRERVRSTFMEDFKTFIDAVVPPGVTRDFPWCDPVHDPEGKYVADCRLNGSVSPPLMVFALPSDDKVSEATITLLLYERWQLPHRSLAIFENQQSIQRNVLARFTDVCEKQFSSLAANRDRIGGYLSQFAPP